MACYRDTFTFNTFLFELRSTGKVEETEERNKCIEKDRGEKFVHRAETENTKQERKGRKEKFT
jgi:hypothetical protein